MWFLLSTHKLAVVSSIVMKLRPSIMLLTSLPVVYPVSLNVFNVKKLSSVYAKVSLPYISISANVRACPPYVLLTLKANV